MAQAEKKEVIDVPIADLVKVIMDYPAYPKFLTAMKRVEILGTPEASGTRVQFEVELIKPIKYVVKIQSKVLPTEAKIWWELEHGELLNKNSGAWSLRALSPSTTEVHYSLEIEVNVPVPGFMMKGLVAKSLPDSIRQMADRARALSSSGRSS